MKKTLPSALMVLVSGCVFLGNYDIHSPEAEGGHYSRTRHIHGGVTKKSPPNAVSLTNHADTVTMSIEANVIQQKTKWGGLLLPIFPMIFYPPIDGYKNEPETLIIELRLITKRELFIYKDSMKVMANGKTIVPFEITYGNETNSEKQLSLKASTESYDESITMYEVGWMGRLMALNTLKLKYPIRAADLLEFKLFPEGIYVGNHRIQFPEIKFKKTRQRWTLVGP